MSEKVCYLTKTLATTKEQRKGTYTLAEAFANKKGNEYVGISLTVFGENKTLADPIQVIDVDLKNIVSNQRDLAKADLFKTLTENKELIIYGEFADGKGAKCGKTDGTVCSGAHVFCEVGKKKAVAALISNTLESYTTTGDVIDSAKGGLSKSGLMHTGLYILYQNDHKDEIGTIEDLQQAFDKTQLKGVAFPSWAEDPLETIKDTVGSLNNKHVRQVKYDFTALSNKFVEIGAILRKQKLSITTWFLACTSLAGDLKRIDRTYEDYVDVLTGGGLDMGNKEYTKQMRSAWETADVLHNTIGNWYNSAEVMAVNFKGFVAPEEMPAGFTTIKVSYDTQEAIEPFATVFNKSRETQNEEAGATDIPGIEIPPNSIVSITGRGGIGKSSIAMLLAAELVRAGKKPLVINREDDPYIIEKRFSSCLTQDERTLIQLDTIKGMSLDIFDSDNIETFTQLFIGNPYEAIKQIKDIGIDCIMIDPFMAMLPPEAEKDNGVAATFMRNVQKGCYEHKMVVFIITHSAKGDGSNVRGSSALIDSNRLSLSVQLPFRLETKKDKERSRYIKFYNNELGDWDIESITRVVMEKNNYGATHLSWNVARMNTGELIVMDEDEFRAIDADAIDKVEAVIDAVDKDRPTPPPRKHNTSKLMKGEGGQIGDANKNKEKEAPKKAVAKGGS